MHTQIQRISLRIIFFLLVATCLLTIMPGCTSEGSTEYTNSNAENTAPLTDSPDHDTFIANLEHSNFEGNTNANLLNGGLATIQGDWIYYCTPEGLFKVNTDGTGETLLFSDADENHIGNINVVGEWIYYDNFIEGSRVQYRIKTNGTAHQQIGMGSHTHVIGDTIYWYDRSIGYRMNVDGSEQQIIFQENIVSDYTFNIYEDWIYFCGEGDDGNDGIYKIRFDGTEKTCLYSKRTDYMVVDNDLIYFQGYRDHNLYRMKLDGSELELVFDDPLLRSFNISDGWIYYCNRNDYCLYRVRTDGADSQKICSDSAFDTSVVGEWIYYKDQVTDGDRAYALQCRIKYDGTERQEFGICDKTYYGDSQTEPTKSASEENYEVILADVLNKDFSSCAGTYSIYQQSPFSEYGDYCSTSISVDKNGAISGQTITKAKPVSVTSNDNGTIMCVISEGKEVFDEEAYITYFLEPREFYVICPPGVTSGFDDYPDYDYLGTDTLRIRYIKIDGGIVDIMYYKN